MKLTPFFDVGGVRYEIKKTRWLIAEHQRISEENPLDEKDRENAVKANNLIADVRRFAEKAKECWETLCESPTEENQRVYLLFKNMSDNAVAEYNSFLASGNSITKAHKHTLDILQTMAIKAIAEQYFDMNEVAAKRIWDKFVESQEDASKVDNWLTAMGDCMFSEDEDEDDDSFLSKKRKMDMEREANRQAAFRKRR